jgi:hypothetical protein
MSEVHRLIAAGFGPRARRCIRKFAAREKAGVTTVKSPADISKTLAGLLKK